MKSDPVIDEIRKIREAHAAKFNYDLSAIYADLRKNSRRRVMPLFHVNRNYIQNQPPHCNHPMNFKHKPNWVKNYLVQIFLGWQTKAEKAEVER